MGHTEIRLGAASPTLFLNVAGHSAGRPGQLPTTNHVQVRVEDRLLGSSTSVENSPIAF